MKKTFFEKGLSLAEVLVASTITIIVLAGILMLSQIVQSSWDVERAKSNLVTQLEMCMERIQKEIRSTDINQIFYYPASAATCSAMSIPLALDNDSDGFIEVDANDKIIWDQTVIYHTYTNEHNDVELRRTLFITRSTLTDAERQQQLNDVVVNGQPLPTTPEYASWDPTTGTRTLCENDNVILAITATEKLFDGYSSTTSRSENITFGSVPLTAGEHYITFTVCDKNSLATGYKIGVDSFSISPSGCQSEAEEVGVHNDGGSAKINEDMTAYGSWNGNRQLEYQASGIDDYIGLNFYYDQWRETNFATSLPSYTLVGYENRTGDGSEESGGNDYAVRLGGFGESWTVLSQTGAAEKTSENFTITDPDGIAFRDVILSRNIDVEGRGARITFDNTQSADSITIDYASIMTRDSGPDGDVDTRKQITFYDAGGGTSISIPASATVDSDWVDVNNFDRSKDYLLTFHLPLPSAGTYDMTCWATIDELDDHSYFLEGSTTVAQDTTWSDNNPTARDAIYTIDSIDASYFSSGTLTSQIYDTAINNPAYDTLTWNIAKNNYSNYGSGGAGANLIIKVRSDDDKDVLKASTDWSSALAVNTLSQVTGSSSVSGIGNGRYCQFQAEFFSQPSTVGAADYLKSCVLKNVSINWPGEDKVVDVSGYFTRRPNYGIFSVKVDEHTLTKGLELKLEISDNLAFNRTITKTLTVEAEPRNTGK